MLKKYWFIIVFVLFQISKLDAQFWEKEIITRIAIINNDTCIIKMDIIKDVSSKKPGLKKTLTYYWYNNNQLHQSQSDYYGNLLHGNYYEFYIDNNLKLKGKFHKGLKDNEWKYWRNDATLKKIIHWKHGVVDGDVFYYDTKGVLELKEEYKNGNLNGKIVKYLNGKPIWQQKYKNNLRNGKEYKLINGKMEVIGNYKKDVLISNEKRYFNNKENEKPLENDYNYLENDMEKKKNNENINQGVNGLSKKNTKPKIKVLFIRLFDKRTEK